jgi:O-antigen ligase
MTAFNLTMFFLLAAFPLLMLTVHHAASTIFFLLLIATLISIPFHKKISWHDSPFPWWLYASILFYPLVVIIHSAVSGVFDKHSFEIASRFLVMPLFLIYRPLIKPDWQRWLYLASAVGAVLCLISAAYTMNFDFSARFKTHFTSVTNFGNLVTLLGVLSLGLVYREKNKYFYIIGVIGILAAASCAFFSQTRTAWVSILFIFLVLLLTLNNVRKISKIIVALIALLCLTLFYFDNPIVNERINLAKQEIIDPSEKNPSSSLGIRKELLKSAWLIIQERPITGVGAGQFPKTLQAQADRGEVLETLKQGYAHPHNETLFAWVELGVFGALGVLAFFLGPALFFYRHLEKEAPSVRTASRLGFLITLSYMVFSLADVMITTWVMESSIFVVILLIPLWIIASHKK